MIVGKSGEKIHYNGEKFIKNKIHRKLPNMRKIYKIYEITV